MVAVSSRAIINSLLLSTLSFFIGADVGGRTECATLGSKNYDEFTLRGGLHATKCPPVTHLEIYAESPCSRLVSDFSNQSLSALVVGGNSGSDCAGLLSFLSGSAEMSLTSWISAIESVTNSKYPRPICPHATYPLMKRSPRDTRTPQVYCIEPLPVNADAIAMAADLKPFKGFMKPIKAAVLGSIPKEGTAKFSKRRSFGFERGHVNNGTYSAINYKHEEFESVVTTTVDAIVDDHLGGTAPLILSIDTEGFDGLVLKGASKTLASGRVGFIEFEYHNIGPWSTMRLQDTVEYLDALEFTCYFANKDGPIPVTCFDWKRFNNKHHWSNLICASRRNSCWAGALEKARPSSKISLR